jgi:hypothetical protein
MGADEWDWLFTDLRPAPESFTYMTSPLLAKGCKIQAYVLHEGP